MTHTDKLQLSIEHPCNFCGELLTVQVPNPISRLEMWCTAHNQTGAYMNFFFVQEWHWRNYNQVEISTTKLDQHHIARTTPLLPGIDTQDTP